MLKWFFPNFWFAVFVLVLIVATHDRNQNQQLISEMEHLKSGLIAANSCPAPQLIEKIVEKKIVDRTPASLTPIFDPEKDALIKENLDLHNQIQKLSESTKALPKTLTREQAAKAESDRLLEQERAVMVMTGARKCLAQVRNCLKPELFREVHRDSDTVTCLAFPENCDEPTVQEEPEVIQ